MEPEPDQPSPQDTIRLDNFLKREGIAQTGGHAKRMIQAGEVSVNGEVETRRRRQLVAGDRVELDEMTFEVGADGES